MAAKRKPRPAQGPPASPLIKGGPRGVLGRPSPLLDTRIVYCGDCLDQLRKLPDACVDLIYIDPPFNSNRNYEVFWGGLSEPRPFESGFVPPFDGRHAGLQPVRAILNLHFPLQCRGLSSPSRSEW